MTIVGLYSAFDRAFHRKESPATLGLFRILFGLLLLANALILFAGRDVWFGPDAMLTRATVRAISAAHQYTLFDVLPETRATVAVALVVQMVAAVCLTVGFRPRIAAFVLFVGLVTFQHRAIEIFNSGDWALRVVTFLLVFCPSGAVWSVDRLLRGDRGPPELVDLWAFRMVKFQVSVIYFATVCCKLDGDAWLDGSAMYYALRLVEYQNWHLPWLFESAWRLAIACQATLLVEFSLGVLVWFRELRYPAILAGLALHLGISFSMNIPMFQWISMVLIVSFVEPRHVEWVLDQVRDLRKRQVRPT
jgi:hypothetical protein